MFLMDSSSQMAAMLIEYSERESLHVGVPHALRFLQAAHSIWQKITRESTLPQSKEARDNICKVLKAIKDLELRFETRDYKNR